MKIKIAVNPVGVLELYFMEERNGRLSIAKPINLEMEEYKEGSLLQPTLYLRGELAHDFLQTLAEELDNKGIKTDKDAKIAGTLDATRYH